MSTDNDLMSDLADWLLARIAEDEIRARNTPGPTWVQGTHRELADDGLRASTAHLVVLHRDGAPQLLARTEDGSIDSARVVQHIIRWSPAHVLAECEAKRRIVQRYVDAWYGANLFDDEEYEQVLRLLALPYADRPGYRGEWRP